MSRRERSTEKKRGELLDPNKKYPKWLEWIRDYGYYYKGVIGIVIAVVAIIFCVMYLVTYQGADMRLYLVTTDTAIEQEPYYQFVTNMNAFVSDVDGDRNAFLRDELIVLSDNPQSGDEQAMYAKLDEVMASDETIALVVDEAGYAYVSEKMKLRELSFFGIVNDDDMKLRLNDTEVLKGVTLGDGRDYYVVMRYFEAESYPKNVYLSGRTDLWVGMMLNNDQSEENNVVITEK